MIKSLNKKSITRASKYLFVGIGTFLFDLLLLFIFTDLWGIDPVISAGLGFLIAVTINYFISRKFVFPETKRETVSGYVIFLLIVGIGFLFVTGLMYLAVHVLEFNYLISRIMIASFVGVFNYLMNLYLNFKVHREA